MDGIHRRQVRCNKYYFVPAHLVQIYFTSALGEQKEDTMSPSVLSCPFPQLFCFFISLPISTADKPSNKQKKTSAALRERWVKISMCNVHIIAVLFNTFEWINLDSNGTARTEKANNEFQSSCKPQPQIKTVTKLSFQLRKISATDFFFPATISG